ncbi:diacylglycerol/lipid kinase family protein [Bacillus weihaiensis]|uniref:diacylglycerol/lipid kinase family protein n=1 Tax=Bacillus weihaiensis TaxID=1547283 RepID=UPI002352AEDF|nr:diacylglycerol kinase family protein [Bacillus weihaiensis]
MRKFRKALLIYNELAGQTNAASNLGEYTTLLTQSVEELLVRKTTKKGDAKELSFEYSSIVDIIFVLGGDGTLHEVINGIGDIVKRPIIAPLPGGTCNDMTRSLNIPQEIHRACEALSTGKVIHVDGVKMNNQYFINFLGVGLIVEASKNRSSTEKSLLGSISYYVSALKSIGNSETFSYSMTLDQEKRTGDAVMILVTNGHYIGTNNIPIQESSLNDGVGEVYVIKKTDFATLMEVIKIVASKKNHLNYNPNVLTCYKASHIVIETDKPMPLDMDGEVSSSTPANIQFLQDHFQFLVPS